MFSQLKSAAFELKALYFGTRASKAMKSGNYPVAINNYQKALKIMEETYGEIEQTMVYVWDLGECYSNIEAYSEAEACYRRLLDYLQSHSWMGGTLNKSIVNNRLMDVAKAQGKEEVS